MARAPKSASRAAEAPDTSLPKNIVDNPILNSPFDEPERYWDFSGAAAVVANGRRTSGYSGVARSASVGDSSQAQLAQIPLKLVNDIRQRVREWRTKGWPNITRTTRDLLEHWYSPDRRPIFFCQREAAETVIWLVEATAADRQGLEIPTDDPVDPESVAKGYLPLLRYCTKMATGSGKTTVMAMLAAWSILNRATSKGDSRFTDAILVIAPNLTVKDRLEVLKPTLAGNYYEKFDLVPTGLREHMKRAKVHVTNWHVFGVKDDTGKRGIVQRGRETDAAFVKRVLKPLGNPSQILVLNDEAHHAWRPVLPVEDARAQGAFEGLDREAKKEAEEEAEEATIWVGGLDRINKVLGKQGQRGIKMVVDVSATPFALKGSGRPEGTPLPWIVSDFSLVEAIESGITKVPRVPVRDDAGRPTPDYFRLWDKIVRNLKPSEMTGKRPKPEAVWREAQPAFEQLTDKWRETWKAFQASGQKVPPAIIVVTANTDIATEFTRRIKGNESIAELAGDVTFQIDTKVLAEAEAEDGSGTKKEQGQVLRLKTATVGKATWEGGTLPASAQNLPEEVRAQLLTPPGRDVRCVVSVAMLTEGWDAQNVTQILGVRAFGSQLLCEQVVGRALRRMSYEVDENRRLRPEYADIFGIPFDALPVQGTSVGPGPPPPKTTLVEAVEERKALRIEFPRVEGYVVDVKQRIRCDVESIPTLTIEPTFEVQRTTVGAKLPMKGSEKLVGSKAGVLETLDREAFHTEHRLQRTAFAIAAEIVRALGEGMRPETDATNATKVPLAWKAAPETARTLFPQVLAYVEEVVEKRVVPVRGARLEEIALAKYRDVIVQRLLDAIEPDEDAGEKPLLPRLRRYGAIGSTDEVQFRTSKTCSPTTKSHINYVVGDSDYERQAMFHLESEALADVVASYVKNDRLDFVIPYEIVESMTAPGTRSSRSYIPDFLIRLKMDDGGETIVVLETKGYLSEHAKEKESAAKRWVRAVNQHGGLGRWDYLLTQKPADIPTELRKLAHAPAFAPAPMPARVEVDDRIARVVEAPAVAAMEARASEDWVGATRVRNWMLSDPLLDWLDAHGKEKGFERDDAVAGYSPLTDFTRFIFGKQREFEAGVLHLIETQAQVVVIANSPEDVRDPRLAAKTLLAMKEGREVIAQPVLHEPDTRIYGSPDFLVRSDVLARIFPGVFEGESDGEAPAAVKARALGGDWHYRVVDVKFTTLELGKDGELGNDGSFKAYKGQLYLYNRALARLQGYLAPNSFLLGRSWNQGDARGTSCLERLARVAQNGQVAKGRSTRDEVEAAVAWIRKVREYGAQWNAIEKRSTHLRPNMKNTLDAPWHGAKRKIAAELHEPTALWQVGVERRQALIEKGIVGWDDPALTPDSAGVKGPKTAPILAALLDVNRDKSGPPVRPARVSADLAEWQVPRKVEMFVDFETVSDLGDDFAALPERGGQAVIYMVGCGHIEAGEWKFACFVADALSADGEARMLDAWFAHMQEVAERLGGVGTVPRLFHWSPAETSNLETAANTARKRHAEKAWPALDTYDFLNRVVKAEPVVVRGALGFGLKAIGKALHAHGLIKTGWADGPTDGLGAMVAAWSAAEQVRVSKKSLGAAPLMGEVTRYNEVDCRVMYEVVDYLRKSHTAPVQPASRSRKG